MTPEIGQVNGVQTSAYQRLARLLVPIGLAVMLFGLLVWPGLANSFGQRFRLSTLLNGVSANPDVAAAGDYVATAWSEGYNGDDTTKEFGRVYLKSADVISGWEARVPLFTASSNDWGKDAKVTFDPNNPSRVHLVWAQADSCAGGGNPLPCKWRTIKYTTCTLNGADNCASPETVYSSGGASDDYSTPDVAVDADGNVHVVWRRSFPAPARLMYAMKSSSGGPFSAADIDVANDGQNPALVFAPGEGVCASNGCLHLVWDAGTTIQYRQDNAPGNGTWDNTANKFWSSPTGYQKPGFPAIGAGDNALYVVWAVQSTSINQEHALAFDFSNNGASWSGGSDGLGIPDKSAFTPFRSAPEQSSAASYLWSLKPDVAVTGTGDSAYAHVVWHRQESSGEGSVYDIWYSYLEGIGATAWTSPVNLTNSSGDSADAAIGVVDAVSLTHVVFMEDANASDSDVWYTGSNTNRENDDNKDEGNIYLPIVIK